jgi:hypothetical protein
MLERRGDIQASEQFRGIIGVLVDGAAVQPSGRGCASWRAKARAEWCGLPLCRELPLRASRDGGPLVGTRRRPGGW